jgi:hypothetical protein
MPLDFEDFHVCHLGFFFHMCDNKLLQDILSDKGKLYLQWPKERGQL